MSAVWAIVTIKDLRYRSQDFRAIISVILLRISWDSHLFYLWTDRILIHKLTIHKLLLSGTLTSLSFSSAHLSLFPAIQSCLALFSLFPIIFSYFLCHLIQLSREQSLLWESCRSISQPSSIELCLCVWVMRHSQWPLFCHSTQWFAGSYCSTLPSAVFHNLLHPLAPLTHSIKQALLLWRNYTSIIRYFLKL